MRIYITGIAGFIGSNIAVKLHDLGHDVTGCDNLQFGYERNVPEHIEWEKMDFGYLKNLSCDCLIHCATSNIIFSQKDPINTFKNNALKTINLFENYTGKVIYTSTASVYGNAEKLPTTEDSHLSVYNAYDQSKLIAERYLKLRKNYTTLRLSNVYGRNQRPENPYAGVIAKFIQSVHHYDKVMIYGDGCDTRDFTYINDVVDGIVKAVNTPALNTEINISSGVETSIINIAFMIFKIFEKEWKAEFKDKRMIDGINRRCLSNERAKKLLNWQPETSLNQGLSETIKNFL